MGNKFIIILTIISILIIVILTPILTHDETKLTNNQHVQEKDIDKYNDVPFDVDIIVTWVNGDDTKRNKEKEMWYTKLKSYDDNLKLQGTNHDEMKYLLRSIEYYMPWIKNIYIVISNQQPPEWLNVHDSMGIKAHNIVEHNKGPKIIWVDESIIIPKENLPLFNSHAFETSLHKIPGLNEHFIYFCDDMMISQILKASDWFTKEGVVKIPLRQIKKPALKKALYHSTARKHYEKVKKETGKSNIYNAQHAPKPMTITIMNETEKMFQEEWKYTRKSKFRSERDMSMYHASSYLAQATGEGKRSSNLVNGFVCWSSNTFLNKSQLFFAKITKCNLISINSHTTIEKHEKAMKEYMESLWPKSSKYFEK